MEENTERRESNCYYHNTDRYCRVKGHNCHGVCSWHITREEYRKKYNKIIKS